MSIVLYNAIYRVVQCSIGLWIQTRIHGNVYTNEMNISIQIMSHLIFNNASLNFSKPGRSDFNALLRVSITFKILSMMKLLQRKQKTTWLSITICFY